MSTYNENSKNVEKQKVVSGIQKLLVEMGKSPVFEKNFSYELDPTKKEGGKI